MTTKKKTVLFSYTINGFTSLIQQEKQKADAKPRKTGFMHPLIYIQTLPTWFKVLCYAQTSLKFHPSSLTFVVPRILKVYHVFLLIISTNLNILLTEACSFCQQVLSINSTGWGCACSHTHTHTQYVQVHIPF